MSYLFVLLTVSFAVYAQVALKWRMLQAGELPLLLSEKIVYVLSLFIDPWVISVIAAIILSFISWIFATSKLELSQAYPFIALSFVFVSGISAFIFGEVLSFWKITGLVCIVSGVILSNKPA